MHLPTVTFNEDFLKGSLFTLGLFLASSLLKLFQYPSESSTQKNANQPVLKIGNDNAITVWGFARHNETSGVNGFLCDYSPYVERVEVYLRLKKIDYTKAVSKGLSESPRKKVPICNVFGTMVDDSNRILAMLHQKLEDDVESTLSETQRAEGTLVRALLTGRLYFVMEHAHFGMQKGREEFRQSLVKDGVPPPLLPLILAMIVRSQHAVLFGAGFAHLPTEEIWDIGRQGLTTLAVLLGNRTFILDTKEANVYDTDVYAFVGHFFYEPLLSDMTWVQETRKEHPVLDQYMNRMRDQLFPDAKKSK